MAPENTDRTATASADTPDSTGESPAPADPQSPRNPDNSVIGGDADWGGLPDMEKPDGQTPEEPGMRPEAVRCAGFCGCFLLLFLIGSGIGGYHYYQYYKEHSDPLVNHYVDLGYAIQKGGLVKIETPLTKDTLILGHQVNIMAPQTVRIAVKSNLCEVQSSLQGTFFYEGKLLTIRPDGKISLLEGNVDTITNQGTITTNAAKHRAINNER